LTLTRKLKLRLDEDEAWDAVSALFAWEPLPSDRAVLKRAREIQRRYGTSWWDSLTVAAALMQDCAVLLSEDLQHGMKFESVTVRNPFARTPADLNLQEPAAAYRAEPPAPRHRPRGRPRKTSTSIRRPASPSK
jgi:hypothetical protein